MKRILVFLLFSFSCLFVSASFQMNENMQNAYLSFIDLQFTKGQTFIDLEKKQNPKNGLIFLNENYKDFLTLIIGEDRQLFDEIAANKNKRLSEIEKCNKNSPYYLYAKAEINLQWAFARLKFQEYFLAAYEIQKAYFLLEENQEKYPKFNLNKKGMGLLHCLIGSIPENYKWIVNSIGINGGIKQGLVELEELRLLTEQDDQYKLYNTELLFLISFLELNLTIDKNNFQKTLDIIGEKYKQHILLTFAASRLSSSLGNNELAIQILKNRPQLTEEFDFIYLDYLMGMSFLYKLDFTNSKQMFHLFLAHFKGENYIKSAYQKLAWIAFLEGKTEMEQIFLERIISEGKTSIDEDKVALKAAEEKKISDPVLLKAGLLYDGGYYEKALNEIFTINNPDSLHYNSWLVEYYYRLARIQSKLENDKQEVITHYQKAIEKGKGSKGYFAPMSVLQIGLIYEKQNDFNQAEVYFKKCLSMSDFDYERGIHQKAKAGLDRIVD